MFVRLLNWILKRFGLMVVPTTWQRPQIIAAAHGKARRPAWHTPEGVCPECRSKVSDLGKHKRKFHG